MEESTSDKVKVLDTFIELCAGSAALTLWMNGRQRPLVAYAGGKRGYVEKIIKVLKPEGVNQFILVDLGPWGRTWKILIHRSKDVADVIESKSIEDPLEVRKWALEKNRCILSDDVVVAASHLLVIASTYGGFEKGGFKGKHKRRPNVDGFIPNRNSLAERVRSLNIPSSMTAHHVDAESIEPFPALVYIDPPYRGTTKYMASFSRESVVKTALKWSKVGSRVVISEGEPIEELVTLGWLCKEITKARNGQNRTNTRSDRELITWNFSGHSQ